MEITVREARITIVEQQIRDCEIKLAKLRDKKAKLESEL
jgi:hypothetical protein